MEKAQKYSAADIAYNLNVSTIAVNKMLAAMGYQEKRRGEKRQWWAATGQGRSYSKTISKNHKVYGFKTEILWDESVIIILKEKLAKKSA